ncbi:MAG TPA: peptidylprolyl isomerase [Anaerolineaceae bacterium]
MRKYSIVLILLAAVVLSACNLVGGAKMPAAGAAKTAPAQNAPAALATRDPNAVEMKCSVVSVQPTPGPTEASIFPPVTSSDWVQGDNAKATLTVLEYSDFQCPYCAKLAPVLTELYKNNPKDVRIVYRYFPLPSHPLSIPSAEAAEAAGMQGKFWEMHDKLFTEQASWATMTPDQFQGWLNDAAKSLGLDPAKFKQDMQSTAVVQKIKQAQDHGTQIGIPGTPFVLVNGKMYPDNLPRDVGNFQAIMDMFKLQTNQFNYCPPTIIKQSKQYVATLHTVKGDIVIQLLPDKAPLAVNSFVFLAQQHWLDNVTFHRVLPDFVAQTGDPSGTGLGSPGYYFADEISDLKFDKAGMVGMANSGPGTNGSQFFITYAAAPSLDGKYTIFGQVIQGLDVAKKLSARDPSQSLGLPPGDKIFSVEIKEK